jgi:hypothetical protein
MENQAKKPKRLFTGLAGSPLAKVGRPRKHADNLARQRAYDRKKARERKKQEAPATRQQAKIDAGYIPKVSPNGKQYAVIPSMPMSRGLFEEGRRGKFIYDSGASPDYVGDRSINIESAFEARQTAQWAARVVAAAKGLLIEEKADPPDRPEDTFARRVTPKGHSENDERDTVGSEGDSSAYLPCGITPRELTYLEELAARNLVVNLSPNAKYGDPEIWACPFHKLARFDNQTDAIRHLWEKHAGKVRTAAKAGASGMGTVHNPNSTRRYQKRRETEKNLTKLETPQSVKD